MMKKLNILSLFSGIGAFEKALERLKVDYKLLGYSEIDKHASKSYCAIHDIDESLNLGDVTKIDAKSFKGQVDILTYGFPCQDISAAGLQRGFYDDNGKPTRSGLFFQALRIIDECKPRLAIAENVEALTFKTFRSEFETVIQSLHSIGYNSAYKVFDARGFGIPQSRRRVFIVSWRRDIDPGWGEFVFPLPYSLKYRLKDFLENEVDDKYYLTQKQIDSLRSHSSNGEDKGGIPIKEAIKDGYKIAKDGDGVDLENGSRSGRRGQIQKCGINTIKAQSVPGIVLHRIDDGRHFRQHQPIEIGGVSQTLTLRIHHPIMIKRERMGLPYIGQEPVRGDGVMMTLTSRTGEQNTMNILVEKKKDIGVYKDYNIRRLTPRECWRLMGFENEDYDKASKVCTESQLYRQAGNSIVVNVLEELFRSIFEKCGNVFERKTENESKNI